MKIVPYSGPINLEKITDINLSQSDVGNNPWVNLHIGRLKFAFDDLSIGSGNSAISLSHVYDSHINYKFAEKIIGFGKNWKLNLTQIILSDNWDADGNSIYKYIDEMGTIHRLVSFAGGWYDDCNAKVVMKMQGNYFELVDGVGNKLRFDSNGYLCESYSCHSVSVCKIYEYDKKNRLVSVYDKRTWSDSKQLAKTRIELEYDDNDLLTSMTSYGDYTKKLERLEYKYDSDRNLIAVYKVAFNQSDRQCLSKQIWEMAYKKWTYAFVVDSNFSIDIERMGMSMVIDCEKQSAQMIQYKDHGEVEKVSFGIVEYNDLSLGMQDASNNHICLGSGLDLGMQGVRYFTEKSFNKYDYKYPSGSSYDAVEATVENEAKIKLKYFMDRKANITASFEDMSTTQTGVNLKTLTKLEGQSKPSNITSELGYINGCDIFLTKKGKFSRTLSPIRMVNMLPMVIETNFNYSFWLKTKKNYDFLEVKAIYKPNESDNGQSREKTVIVNSKAVDAWQQVVIPVSLTENCLYNIDVSFLVDKHICNDDFEICDIGMTPSPHAELMLSADKTVYLPLSAVEKVKLKSNSAYAEDLAIGANFYLTEADIISSYINKYKSKTGTFDLISNNGTKRRSNITDIQFYFPLIEWGTNRSDELFYIYTALPTKDAHIKTYYQYETDGSGFVIKNDYFKTIDGEEKTSSTFLKMDYTGKTIYEIDEYGTKKDYQYYNDGNLKQLSVVNGTSTQSIQKFEYDSEGRLTAVDDGLNKQIASYDDVSRSQTIKTYSYKDNTLIDTGHSLTNNIGIFRDKQISACEFDGADKVGSINLTYEKGQMRTITDGLVKYGVKHDLLKDCVMYTQFEGQAEKPIQMDTVSDYKNSGGKYYKTHTSKFYDENGKVTDSSFVDIDAYGKPIRSAKDTTGTCQFDSANVRERYSYVYNDVQESEYNKKPGVCKNLDDNSSTEYKYDNDGNLIGWKETEAGKQAFEVKQIAPTATKYIFGNNEQEYFVQINHQKDKTAAPRIESIVVREDNKSDIDKPIDMFQVNYKWKPLGNLDEIKTNFSTEKYGYLTLSNNLLLENINYSSYHKTQEGVTTTVSASNNLKYYDNGLIKQETITNKEVVSGVVPVVKPAFTSTRTLQYDNLHRITKEINTGLGVSRTYSYYPDGRLKSIAGDKTDDVRNFVYDAKGRLVSINDSTTYSYNHFGNRIAKTVNGVITPYTFDIGGRLVSAGGVKYSYNADGIRCKKTCIANGIAERMYLDGGKILGEDRANCKLRYFYDATGLKRIRRIEKNYVYDYECVKDSQGSIIMLLSVDGGICCRYEYDALGKCTIIEQSNSAGDINPFRWKGFFYDSETGFYYANGSYYDPETGLYVDAAPVSTVFDNADSPRYIDRNGLLCYNPNALAGSLYTAFTTVEMAEDPSYDPGKTWWEKLCRWWDNIPKWIKFGIGILIIVGLTIATIATGGSAGGLAGAVCAGALKSAVIGATSGAVISGTIGGIISASNNQGFWDGFANGAADGFLFGAISGAIAGGISAYSNYGNFASANKLQSHFEDHGTKMGYASSAEYARDAKYVIRNGTKVVYPYNGKPTVGYVKFWSIGREANYVLVGMNGTHTATFGIRRVSDLIDLGITLFVR